MPNDNHLPKPDAQTMSQADQLLQAKLLEKGVDPKKLEPYEISEGMHCSVYPDGSLYYLWKGELLLAIIPEQNELQNDHSGKKLETTGTLQWKLCEANNSTDLE